MRMRQHREVYKSWTEALDMASEDVRSSGEFHYWVQRNYVAFMVMAIRREDDGKKAKDSTSLRRLLNTIHENAHLLSRDWYFERSQPTAEFFEVIPPVIASWFEEQWSEVASNDGSHVDPEKVQADIDRLELGVRTTSRWATAHVAHRLDWRTEVEALKLAEIHAAVDEIEELWRKWYLMLTGKNLGFLDPDPWEFVLTMPWITKDQANELLLRRRAET
jgi:hypothetical protein